MSKEEKLKDEPRYKVVIGFERDFKLNYVNKFKIALSAFQKGFEKLTK